MRTIKITEEAYDILRTIKWSTKSETFSATIIKMDEAIRIFTPKDHNANRTALRSYNNDQSKK